MWPFTSSPKQPPRPATIPVDEMYFDCPQCHNCERLNNVGKKLYQSNPFQFQNIKCIKCKHEFNAAKRMKFGPCPGFDYSTLNEAGEVHLINLP